MGVWSGSGISTERPYLRSHPTALTPPTFPLALHAGRQSAVTQQAAVRPHKLQHLLHSRLWVGAEGGVVDEQDAAEEGWVGWGVLGGRGSEGYLR